jgi:tRNA-2-methylthio-N6-dimethylallyladenosine synthase
MPRVFGQHQAYVRITRGCNKFCTFCVVPYTRGPEVHRPPDQIVDEVRRLADSGVMEVTLLGQTVNHYHYQPEGGGRATSFAELLRRVHDEVPQLPRLRFVTSFPRDFTNEALEVMAASPRICRYLHIPAQSGSNSVLKRMNRGYSVEEYRALLDRARALMPDLSIAGDMIVGFCGETEDDFQESVELLRYAQYKNCYIFKYSPRPGTTADDRLADDVPDEVKRRRNNDLLAVQAEISQAHHRAMLEQSVDVLVEGFSKRALKAQESEQSRGEEIDPRRGFPARRDQLVGRTSGDQIVVFDGSAEWIGRIIPVRIVAATPYTLQGEPIADASAPTRVRTHELPLPVLVVS